MAALLGRNKASNVHQRDAHRSMHPILHVLVVGFHHKRGSQVRKNRGCLHNAADRKNERLSRTYSGGLLLPAIER